MLIVKYKDSLPELQYSLDIIFKQFLGLDYQFQKEPVEYIEISQPNDKKKLSLNADFFNIIEKHWLSPKSMPVTPLKQWQVKDDHQAVNLVEPSVPIIYGKSGFKQIDKNHWHLGLDIFGSSFFMLSRYEEAIITGRDKHDRFPASASLAYQEGFLDRPIVNEYLEILWYCLKKLWSQLKRRQHQFQMRVSCDVDHLYQCSANKLTSQIRHIAGDLIIRKSPLLALKSTLNYFFRKFGSYTFDSYYSNLIWIMKVNEVAGNKVIFYFMAGQTDKNMDGCYQLDEPIVRQVMRQMAERGHQIGLHPSYQTYKSQKQLHKEADNLRRVMKEEGVSQQSIGSRQHYLRWDSFLTPNNIENTNITHDSTLGFAEQQGFRCGTCYDYTMYDLSSRMKLNLTQYPLTLMEGTLLSSRYQNTKKEKLFLQKSSVLINHIKHYDGMFTLLWHNSYLGFNWYNKAYKTLTNTTNKNDNLQ